MLPSIIFVIAIIFSVKPYVAFRSALFIGVGLVGIGILFSFFIQNVEPIIEVLAERTGKETKIIDVGWPVLSSLIWSAGIAPLTVPIALAVNIIMVMLKITDTFNIDIWNFWHVALVGVVVYEQTNIMWVSLASIAVMTIVNLKLADWTIPVIKRYYKIEGISDSTLTSITFLPAAIIANFLIDKLPLLKKVSTLNIRIKGSHKLINQPGLIAFIIGIAMSALSGYNFTGILDFSIKIAAVFLILPKIVYYIQEGFYPLTEGIKKFVEKKLKRDRSLYIGVNHMVFMGDPSVISCSIILIPIIVVISFMLPAIDFFPIGDLTNIIGVIVMIVGVAKGNILRSIILSVPVLIISMKTSAYMAPVYTKLADRLSYPTGGGEGYITSSMNGGDPINIWLIKLFQGNYCAIAVIPLVLAIFYIARKLENRSEFL